VKTIVKKTSSFLVTVLMGFFLTVVMICCVKQVEKTDSGEMKMNFNIREGKRLFIRYCAPCHGEDAEGSGRYFPSYIDPRPPDFINSDYFQETHENVMFRAIKFGSKSLGKSKYSPPYGETLRDEEIRYIIEYIKFLKKSKEEEGEEDEMGLKND
jgi:mono/diheme cytochrome c family protein